MNNDLDAKGIFGLIFAILLVIVVILPIFSLMFNSLGNIGNKQQKIDELNGKVSELEQDVSNKDIEINQLKME